MAEGQLTRFLRRPIHPRLPLLTVRVLVLAIIAAAVWGIVYLQLAFGLFLPHDIAGTL